MAEYFAKTSAPAGPYDYDASDRWLEARRRIFKDDRFIHPWRDYTEKVGSNEYRTFYLNCLGDAFLTAAKTLDERIARFGADSDEVRTWATAQDQVFSNCGEGESIPELLGEDASPAARADRAYQIASAHFYAGHFAEAQRLYRSIADDKASAWSTLGAYLVARAMLREAVLRQHVDHEGLRATEAYLHELLADSSRREIHPAAERLLDHVRAELAAAAGSLRLPMDPARLRGDGWAGAQRRRADRVAGGRSGRRAVADEPLASPAGGRRDAHDERRRSARSDQPRRPRRARVPEPRVPSRAHPRDDREAR